MQETSSFSRFSPRHLVSWMLPISLLVLLAIPGSLRGILSASRGATPTLEAWENAMPLAGVTINEARPLLHRRNWLSGDFQAKYGRWFGQNFGLRSRMVRVDNQIAYTIFHKSNTNINIRVGRNRMLYEGVYVDEYCGIYPPATDAQLETLASDIADVGARLRKQGVGFVLYIAPSKAALYPESLPPAFLSQKTSLPRGYDRLIPLLKQHHVVYVDGHAILMDAKATKTTLPLYCRGGTHYSDLGMFYVARTLFQTLEKEGGKPVPPLLCSFPVPVDYHPIPEDDDLARLLNAYISPTYYLTPHPALTFDWTHTKPGKAGKLSIIGGSFCWQPLRLLEKHHVYEQMDYYYYYRTSLFHYPNETQKPLDVATLDWNTSFLRSNVIVLEINEHWLYDSGDTHFRAFLRDAKRKLPPVDKPTPQN